MHILQLTIIIECCTAIAHESFTTRYRMGQAMIWRPHLRVRVWVLRILFGSTVIAVLRLGIGDSDIRQHKENLMWWIPSLSRVVCPVLGVGVDVGPP